MKNFLFFLLALFFSFSQIQACENGMCQIRQNIVFHNVISEYNYLKEWRISPGQKIKIKLGVFQLLVDNTAGAIIFHGGGRLVYQISQNQEIEIPIIQSRRQIWLIGRHWGYRVEFFHSKGTILVYANQFLIKNKK